MFTDKVSTGPNSNTETRIKKLSAYCSQQELPYCKAFLALFVVFCHTGVFWGHFTETSGRLSLWRQVSCKGQQKVQQQWGLWLLKSRAGKLSPLSCEPPKANLQWLSKEQLGEDQRQWWHQGTGTPKPAGHFRVKKIKIKNKKEKKKKSLLLLKEKGKSWNSKETSHVIYNIYKSLLSGKCYINFFPLYTLKVIGRGWISTLYTINTVLFKLLSWHLP